MLRFIIITVGLATLLGAQDGPQPMSPSGSPAAADVLVSTQWLADHLQDRDLVIIHVGARVPMEDGVARTRYRDRHLPEARHLAWNRFVTNRNGLTSELPKLKVLTRTMEELGIDERSRIVLYDTGTGLEAARAYVTFDHLGLGPRTSVLNGQWKEWIREERPTTTETPCYLESDFSPERRGPVFINWPTLRSMIYTGDPYGVPLALFDARPLEEFSGDRAGKGVARPGHIPHAESIPWDEIIMSRERPLFRPGRELHRLFETYGARPGCLVVTYCRTGVKASLLYVAARHLGYRTRLYDGSFMEWSSLEDLPVIDGVWAE